MIEYIKQLKNKLNSTDNKNEIDEILNLLSVEKHACKDIIHNYSSRENRTWFKSKEICEHEHQVIQEINEIFKFNNK